MTVGRSVLLTGLLGGVVGGVVGLLGRDLLTASLLGAGVRWRGEWTGAGAEEAVRGLGVDVEDIARWRKPRRLADLFTPDELNRARISPEPARHHAGWWAAREATVKALRGEVTVRQVSVVHDDEGRPTIVVAGRPDLSECLDLSISHSGTTAVAVVVRR